ncbi:MAG: phospholipase D-like domain-containing protein [Bacillus sp. (in: Bacteria)]|nr:phospholipase D-like domain-containing protein [Bacillus sp. (in: firmicutes)]
MFKKKTAIDTAHLPLLQSKCPQDDVDEFMKSTPEPYFRFFKLAQNIAKTPLSVCSETKVFNDGQETFTEILTALKQAKDHIHLEYYVVRDDTIGRQIKEILIEKAMSGVEVRFLYDTIGCWFLPKSYLKELKDAGVQAVPFYSASHRILKNKMNFTSHRKILVIDGKIGFVGGMNIGDEYLGKHPYFGNWRDTHLMVKGDAVTVLHHIFLVDWYYNTGEPIINDRYLIANQLESTKSKLKLGAVQIVPSGPDQKWAVMKKLYLSLITSAQKKNPYHNTLLNP